MGGPRAPSALMAASRRPGSRGRCQAAANISAAARVMTAINTAKQECPTKSIGAKRSVCGATTEVEGGLIPAGSGSACWMGVALAMVIGIICAVGASTR